MTKAMVATKIRKLRRPHLQINSWAVLMMVMALHHTSPNLLNKISNLKAKMMMILTLIIIQLKRSGQKTSKCRS